MIFWSLPVTGAVRSNEKATDLQLGTKIISLLVSYFVLETSDYNIMFDLYTINFLVFKHLLIHFFIS